MRHALSLCHHDETSLLHTTVSCQAKPWLNQTAAAVAAAAAATNALG
jgi:hypothetical protein